MDKPAEESVSRRSRGLERAFDILDCLRGARKPMRPNEIATAMGAPRSTIYELVNMLLKCDVLEYRGGDGRVFLGRKLFLLGAAYSDNSDFLPQCSEVLEQIASETLETAQFCLLDVNKYTVALVKESSRPFRISSSVGERTPLPWTASGRLFVDHMSDERILEFIPRPDFHLPSGAWLEPTIFISEVRQAAKDGYFTADSIVDSYTHCFAVPVRRQDGIAAATLCLVTPKDDARLNRERYLSCLTIAAEKLSVQFMNLSIGADLNRFPSSVLP